MKRLLLAAGAFLCLGHAMAQTWSYPAQTFTGSTNICDAEPYKLVFFDDFNGTSLSSRWLRFMSWSGMSRTVGGTTVWGDHDDWGDTRLGGEPRNGVYRDQNVQVSGGMCHLYVRKEPVAWKCATCDMADSFRGNYSYGCIALPYINADRGRTGFDNGKFEARISFPLFKGFWGAYWLNYGSIVNELDIAEAYGPKDEWPYLPEPGEGGYEHPKVGDNLHAWAPPDTANIYGLPRDAATGKAYPNQAWSDFVRRRAFNQQEFHIYTSEWDSTCIRTYLDHELVNTVWKYYQDRHRLYWSASGSFWYTYRVGPGCLPSSGTWNVTYAFPYEDSSNSQLRFSTSMHKDFPADMTGYTTPVTLGSMDIDYVKVWQRHPEVNNHTEICSSSAIITGPDTICSNGTYSVPATIGGSGTWSVSNDALYISGGTGTSRVFSVNTSSVNTSAVISYTFVLPGCPKQTISKRVVIARAVASPVSCVRIMSSTMSAFQQLSLNASRDIPGATYEWNIYYGLSAASTTHYHTYGRHVTTPYFVRDGSRYYARWTLKITTRCGSVTTTGTSSYGSGYGFRPLAAIFNQDSTVLSVDVHFNSAADTAAYEQAVYNRIAQTFVNNPADTNAIDAMISRVRFEELAPYIVFGQAGNRPGMEEKNSEAAIQSATLVYPNPTTGELHIIPDEQYKAGEKLMITILDMTGRAVQSKNIAYTGSEVILSLANLPEAIYSLELKQPKLIEHFKVSKASGQ